MKLSSSKRINFLLSQMGIFSFYDVIYHLPRRYEDYSLTDEEDNLIDKQKITLLGQIISEVKTNNSHKLSVSTFDFLSINKRYYKVVAYNRDYLKNIVKINDIYTIYASFNKKRNELDLINLKKGDIGENEKIKPIYSLPSGLKNHEFIRLVKKAFKNVGNIFSFVPYYFINKYHLVNKRDALYYAHFPADREDIKKSLLFLKYEEALKFALNNKLIKEDNLSLSKYKVDYVSFEALKPLIESLPFTLNNDQVVALKEIIDDLNNKHLMYRLLQGDVGSGKTIVALISCFASFLRGTQSAFMCPTEVLARQHYLTAKEIFKNEKINIALLVGSLSSEEKRNIFIDLKDGLIDLVIGTHSLFSKSVKYNNLGLAIIDEQHRFGVNQRRALLSKNDNVDLLMMSATPIPRSLALTVFGDLDISTLYSFPSSKRDVKTILINNDQDKLFSYIDKVLSLGKKIYIVLPLIDLGKNYKDSIENIYPIYKERYKDLVGKLHGKMKSEEKEKAILDFTLGKTKILVSTQVIEVGIDVKDALLMIIYGCERFGLASLHQLRGRVGRDGSKAACVLVYDKDIEGEEDRLKTFAKTDDGFKLAEQDLINRGPGELIGVRQSGLPDFHYLNVVNDLKIFKIARKDADEIFSKRFENDNFMRLINYIRKTSDEDKINKG